MIFVATWREYSTWAEFRKPLAEKHHYSKRSGVWEGPWAPVNGNQQIWIWDCDPGLSRFAHISTTDLLLKTGSI